MSGEVELVLALLILFGATVAIVAICFFFYADRLRNGKSPFEQWIEFRRDKLMYDALRPRLVLRRQDTEDELSFNDVELDDFSDEELGRIAEQLTEFRQRRGSKKRLLKSV